MKRKGFMLLDALLACGILTSTLILISSVSFLHYKATQENDTLYTAMVVMENHLAELSSSADWESLDGTEKSLGDNMIVKYAVKRTDYATKQLNVVFNMYGRSYSFVIERSDPNGQ